MIHNASRSGDAKLLKQLLDEGAPVDEMEHGIIPRTALMVASMAGHTEVVKLLLDRGARVEEKEWGLLSTALMLASQEGCTEVVKLLLDKGALIDEEDDRTALRTALIIDEVDDMTALMMANQRGHTEVVTLLLDTMVKRLLEKGASLLEKDKLGRTLLMKASKRGYTGMVKRLLEKGAPVDEEDEHGRTALMLATGRGYTELVMLLLDQGARVDLQTKWGPNALADLVSFDEDQLGRMAAAQVHKRLHQTSVLTATVEAEKAEEAEPEIRFQKEIARLKVLAEATAMAVLQLVYLAGLSRACALKLCSSDPRSADDHQALFTRLQLAAAACLQNDKLGQAHTDGGYFVQKLLGSKDGRKALEHAVQIEAKQLLAQPVVQTYVESVLPLGCLRAGATCVGGTMFMLEARRAPVAIRKGARGRSTQISAHDGCGNCLRYRASAARGFGSAVGNTGKRKGQGCRVARKLN